MAAKQYTEAVAAFEAGLAIDPADANCLAGLQEAQVGEL